jgi:hypothetical protein
MLNLIGHQPVKPLLVVWGYLVLLLPLSSGFPYLLIVVADIDCFRDPDTMDSGSYLTPFWGKDT